MLNLYIMSGLAFSGKSTLARKIAEHTGSRLISFDKLWVEKDKLQTIPKGGEGWQLIRKVAREEITDALKEGKSVVYDDNNVRLEHREEIKNIAKRVGANSIVVYLNTPLELIRERELANKITGKRHEVEPENFQKVMEQLEVPTLNENVFEFTPKTDLEKFINELPR